MNWIERTAKERGFVCVKREATRHLHSTCIHAAGEAAGIIHEPCGCCCLPLPLAPHPAHRCWQRAAHSCEQSGSVLNAFDAAAMSGDNTGQDSTPCKAGHPHRSSGQAVQPVQRRPDRRAAQCALLPCLRAPLMSR